MKKQAQDLLDVISFAVIRFLSPFVIISVLACCAIADAGMRSEIPEICFLQEKGHNSPYSIDISISRKVLILYKNVDAEKRLLLREYRVGTAVAGIDVYPLGIGKVTAISFNPWWYPTNYSRQVFRKRGIELPTVVPPGHPLNYMGAVKISLSHRTRKGAIYRIHGNNNPGRVGRRVTGGCFVMYNNDVIELARTISVGTEVNILP